MCRVLAVASSEKKGLRLAILSNGEPKMLQAAAQSADIAGLLAAIISVEDVKTFKPAPPVYALIARRLNVAATEVGSLHWWRPEMARWSKS